MKIAARSILLALLMTVAIGCGDKKSKASKEDKDDDDSSGSSKSSGDEVAITPRYTAVGDVQKGTKVTTSEMKAKIKGGPGGMTDVAMTETETIHKTEECVAVGDKQCMKAKVTYTKYEHEELVNGKPKNDPAPAVGKVYLIERKGDALLITLEDGSPAPDTETVKLRKSYKRFGRHKDLAAALPKKVKVGDSLDDLAKVLGEEAAAGDAGETDEPPKVTAKVVVKSIREEGGKKIVACDVTMTMEGNSKKVGHVKLDMKGTIDLRADIGQPVASDLGGPMEIDLAEDGGKINGTMKEKTTSSFSF